MTIKGNAPHLRRGHAPQLIRVRADHARHELPHLAGRDGRGERDGCEHRDESLDAARLRDQKAPNR